MLFILSFYYAIIEKIGEVMKEKNAIFIINILKHTIDVYFNTFFIFYFFQVANYEVVPLAKYYLTLYLFVGIGFFIIRKGIKKNIKVPYFRIGIALQALYIALIMLLKENIIHYIFLVGIIKGIAEGFYYFPKNVLDTEKIVNDNRQKFNGFLQVINQLISIVVPIILGVLLTFFSYIDLGKIFFLLFIVMFLVSFCLDDYKYYDRKPDFKGFKKVLSHNSHLKYAVMIPLFSGLTYSSGVMTLIVTLFKINNFETNLNLGIVDSICALLSLLMGILFISKIKKNNFSKFLSISGSISFLTLILFAFVPTRNILILYLIVNCSFILVVSMISELVVVNMSNDKHLKDNYKMEFYFFRDILFSISRSIGYLLLFVVSFFFGIEYIRYLMIICAMSILIEAFIISKINQYS